MHRRGRPKGPRWIKEFPKAMLFKPRGLPLNTLERVEITIEELEAMRLVDFLGLGQEEAAKMMGVSRKTLWMDLKEGRRKVIEGLIEGKAIELKGSHPYTIRCTCEGCGSTWFYLFKRMPRRLRCPSCKIELELSKVESRNTFDEESG
jgi:hypothetical protein